MGTRFPIMTASAQAPSFGNRLITIGLGLLLASAGAFFCVYLWKDYQATRETDHWVETPCEILASTVDENGLTQHGSTRFQLEVRYRYLWDGRSMVGDKVKPHRPIASSHRKMVAEHLEKYPVGLQTTCFVNPDAPEEAVLKLDTKAALYSIWFPALFVVGGVGIAASGLRRSKSANR